MRLTATTYDKRLLEFQPLQFGQGERPSWWAELKKTFQVLDHRTGIKVPNPTVKACPGVVDYIRKPMNIKLWSDAIFKVFPDGRINVSTPLHNGGEVSIGVHEQEQYGSLYPNHVVCKLHNPWVMEASDRTEFLCTDVHYDKEFRKHGMFIAPGITNFYDQHVCNIFIVFPRKEDPYQIELKYGQPLMSVYPMTDKKINLKMKLATKQECQDIANAFPPTFLGRYYTRKHARR